MTTHEFWLIAWPAFWIGVLIGPAVWIGFYMLINQRRAAALLVTWRWRRK